MLDFPFSKSLYGENLRIKTLNFAALQSPETETTKRSPQLPKRLIWFKRGAVPMTKKMKLMKQNEGAVCTFIAFFLCEIKINHLIKDDQKSDDQKSEFNMCTQQLSKSEIIKLILLCTVYCSLTCILGA